MNFSRRRNPVNDSLPGWGTQMFAKGIGSKLFSTNRTKVTQGGQEVDPILPADSLNAFAKSRCLGVKHASLIFLLTILFFSSCKKQIIPSEDVTMGKEYYPTSIGHFIEYHVDSLFYDDFNKKVDTATYQLKDIITDTFTDNEGRLSQYVIRYKRYNDTLPWESHSTYYITQTSFRMEVIEDNLRFIKLVFPVKENQRWYGNTYIPTKLNSELQWLDQWYYKYEKINESFDTGFMLSNHTVTVNENDYHQGDPDTDPDHYASKIYAKEVYAKQIGLIYREIENWVYQPTRKYRNGFKIIFRTTNHN